jgi:hypothetical protein
MPKSHKSYNTASSRFGDRRYAVRDHAIRQMSGLIIRNRSG